MVKNKVFTLEDIEKISKKTYNTETRTPVNVPAFFSFAFALLLQLFSSDNPDEAVQEASRQKLFDFLRKYYVATVNGAKMFKTMLIAKTDTSLEIDPANVNPDLVDFKSLNYSVNEIHANGQLWLAVVKGSENKDDNVSSQIIKATDSKTKGEKFLAVVTFRLFQAIISISCASLGLFDLDEAPLMANIFKTCTLQACKEYKWGIHGHSGLNFVANFVRYYTYTEFEKDDETNLNLQKTVISSFPTLRDILAAAYRLDEFNHGKVTDKTKAMDTSTIDSIIRATQLRVGSVENLLRGFNWESFPEPQGSEVKKASRETVKMFKSLMISPSSTDASASNVKNGSGKSPSLMSMFGFGKKN